MTIQSTNTEAGLTFTADGQVWIVAPNVVVTGPGDAVAGGFNTERLENYGVISAPGDGVSMGGTGAYIYNAASGTVSAAHYGVYVSGLNAVLSNAGYIHGMVYGFCGLSEDGSVENTGTISGDLAGFYVGTSSSGTSLSNSGSILSQTDAVVLNTEPGLVTTIVNSGLIQGVHSAISDTVDYKAALSLINTGRLVGDVDVRFESVGSSVVNSGSLAGVLTFGAGADTYDGRGGTVSGTVSGADGNDLLIGGTGDEVFVGGLGRDRMDGGRGPGEDTFVFASFKDSRSNAPDVITKHWSAADTIDMSGVDASSAGGFQHLVYGGKIAAGDALALGKVAYYQQAGDTFVVADVDGDGKADFTLQIHGLQTLTAGEFVL